MVIYLGPARRNTPFSLRKHAISLRKHAISIRKTRHFRSKTRHFLFENTPFSFENFIQFHLIWREWRQAKSRWREMDAFYIQREKNQLSCSLLLLFWLNWLLASGKTQKKVTCSLLGLSPEKGDVWVPAVQTARPKNSETIFFGSFTKNAGLNKNS